jgi:ABC-type phosphate/phosphonate transport system substrate-binding protein
MFEPIRRWIGPIALAFALLGFVGLGVGGEGGGRSGNLVRVGMVGSLFRDLPEPTAQAMMQPFSTLMESQTGLPGQVVPGGSAEHLGQQLAEDKVQLGVFHGIEFAWARQKHPELQPLMIAVNQCCHLHACLVVKKDGNVATLNDLKGQTLALPRFTREHCHVYIERRAGENGQALQGFFGKVTNPASIEDALDDVVDGVAQATVVDGVALDCYQRRKPGRFAKLKMIQQSETFPAAVVAYRPGALDEATVKRLRDGMVGAAKTPVGKQLLTLFKLTGFEQVPRDYEQTLSDIVKSYPPPANGGK